MRQPEAFAHFEHPGTDRFHIAKLLSCALRKRATNRRFVMPSRKALSHVSNGGMRLMMITR